MELTEKRVSELESELKLLKTEKQKLLEELSHVEEVLHHVDCVLFKFIRRADERFEYTFLSGRTAKHNNILVDEIVGKTPEDLFDKEIAAYLNLKYKQAYDGEKVTLEVTYESAIYSVVLLPRKLNGLTIEVVGTATDISEKKQMEDEIVSTERKFQAIFEEALDAILLFDHTGVPIDANPAASHLLGFSIDEIKRAEHFKILDPEIRERIPDSLKKLLELGKITGESRVTNKDGSVRYVEHVTKANILPNVHLTILRDITGRKKMEESIRKSETLHVVGELAAGIGHEIRNPMTSLKGFIQLLKEDLVHFDYYDVIMCEFQRIDAIIAEFMILSKPQAIEMKEASIENILEQAVLHMETQAGVKNIQIHLQMEENLPHIICEKNQLKQVFINLIKNGIESMEDEQNIYININSQEDSIIVEIKDEGCGIPPNILEKIGEPFYTTKDKGTGLGLMISYKIIQNHHGTVDVKSIEGKGTTFTITLPIYQSGTS
ncbi:PAS domain-containing sensor histidine kinase [Pseudalkalibacillus berkeleyi]|uniref:histidine kinase n=1 Tax=Pseudalkalibacillus berkeleyi TaxID=1069813 RepID=A0ABS9H457_9BACL|nr:PAS domain-containing sensor histidine kinase [Pseudalkalibacillus berkeleyi]MCF6138622.1 ATP-binding protein [Pseudalkalibacillus berkeleyi]